MSLVGSNFTPYSSSLYDHELLENFLSYNIYAMMTTIKLFLFSSAKKYFKLSSDWMLTFQTYITQF